MSTLAVCVDLMRDFQTADQLAFAAQSIGLYALSLSVNANGTYSPAQAKGKYRRRRHQC